MRGALLGYRAAPVDGVRPGALAAGFFALRLARQERLLTIRRFAIDRALFVYYYDLDWMVISPRFVHKYATHVSRWERGWLPLLNGVEIEPVTDGAPRRLFPSARAIE